MSKVFFTCAQYVFDKVSALVVSAVEKCQEQEQWSNNNFPDLLGLSEFSGARTCQFEYLPICPFQGSNKIGPFSKSLADLKSLVPAYISDLEFCRVIKLIPPS